MRQYLSLDKTVWTTEVYVFTKPILIGCFPRYERLGYDAVNRTGRAHLECSPLFCNGRAGDIPVNRFCLIDEPDRALALAQEYSGSNGSGCEPGDYFALEVWRKSTEAGYSNLT